MNKALAAVPFLLVNSGVLGCASDLGVDCESMPKAACELSTECRYFDPGQVLSTYGELPLCLRPCDEHDDCFGDQSCVWVADLGREELELRSVGVCIGSID
ncbi:MAG: hypothetical protein AAGN82_13500 [Myxococcota bacterium]